MELPPAASTPPVLRPGDRVAIIGDSITAQDVADWAGTIPYEVLTNINARVPRLYVP